MPHTLRKIPFSEELLSVVQGFCCGDSYWEREVGDWIARPRGQRGALDDMSRKKRPAEVWLHATDDRQVVGFSSLAESNWNWPTPNDPRVPISLIPNVAVHRDFQGRGYFSEIFSHLAFEARQKRDRQPILGLLVHLKNEKAQQIYRHLGFAGFGANYQDPETGDVYQRMFYRLP